MRSKGRRRTNTSGWCQCIMWWISDLVGTTRTWLPLDSLYSILSFGFASHDACTEHRSSLASVDPFRGEIFKWYAVLISAKGRPFSGPRSSFAAQSNSQASRGQFIAYSGDHDWRADTSCSVDPSALWQRSLRGDLLLPYGAQGRPFQRWINGRSK